MELRNFYLSAGLFLLLVQLSFSTIFTGLEQSRVDADLVQNLTLNITSSGTQLSDGDLLCSGLPITINTTFDANYTALANEMVPCPTFGCGPRPSVANDAQPFPIALINQTFFSSNVSYYYGTQYYASGIGSSPFSLFNWTGTYYTPPPGGIKTPDASFMHRMFCYGSILVYENSSVILSSNLNSSLLYAFTPSGIGNVFVRSSFSDCAMFVRTWETDGPAKDSVFTSSFSAIAQQANISIVDGPSFSVTSPPGSYDVTPNGTVTFTFTLNNAGDMDASITGVALTGGFSVSSYSPSTVLAGQSVSFSIVATAPDVTPGTIVSPIATVSYSSTSAVVGACGTGSAGGIAIGTVLIGEVDPIDVGIEVTPSGVFVDGNDYSSDEVSIEASIDRENPDDYGLDDIETNITISIYNSTADDWNEILEFTGITGLTGTQVVNGTTAEWSFTGGELVIEVDYSVLGLDPGVYRADIDSYDPFPQDDNYESDSAYFVIFTAQSCVERV